MKIGIDCHVSRAAQRRIVELGHEIVVTPEHAESDASWCARAVAAGAEAVVSADSDLGPLAYRAGVYFIRIPGHTRSAPQVQHVERALARIADRTEPAPRASSNPYRLFGSLRRRVRVTLAPEPPTPLTWTPPGPESAAAVASAEERRRLPRFARRG